MLKIVGLSLVLGGAFLLTGCLTVGWRTRPEAEEVPRVVEAPEVVEVPRVVEAPRVVPAVPEFHTVVRGETLWDIAGQYYGDPTQWRRIFEANRHILDNPDRLKAGQELIIPQK